MVTTADENDKLNPDRIQVNFGLALFEVVTDHRDPKNWYQLQFISSADLDEHSFWTPLIGIDMKLLRLTTLDHSSQIRRIIRYPDDVDEAPIISCG